MSTEHTATDADRASLDRSLLDGMAWSAVLRWSAQIISWIGTGIAARLLTPGDYGLIGMAMLAIGLLRMVEDFGMDAVLVQDRTIEGSRQARLAGLVLAMGVALSLLFVALSGVIAGFFNEPQVAGLIIVLSSLCVADALQVIPRALLQRRMAFRRLAVLQLIQVVTTQSVLVAGAYLGWGVWSLAFNTVAGAALCTVLLIWWQPFQVAWPRGLRELATPLLQGWRILASRFAYYAYSSGDQAVIGRVLGKDALGVYSFAMTFSTTVSQEISSVASRVVPSVFSAVQTNKVELRRYFLVLTELLSYLALPVSLGMAVTADYVVAIVLGPQWDAVILPLRILCVYSAFYTCQVLIGHLLLWTGRFRANMWCSWLAAVVLPIGFYYGTRWGVIGIAWTWVILFPLLNIPAIVIAFRANGISVLDWLSSFFPALAASVAMIAAVMLTRSLLPSDLSVVVAAAVSVASGAVIYGATLCFCFPQRVRSTWQFLQRIRSRTPPAAEIAPQPAG